MILLLVIYNISKGFNFFYIYIILLNYILYILVLNWLSIKKEKNFFFKLLLKNLGLAIEGCYLYFNFCLDLDFGKYPYLFEYLYYFIQ